jgi:hypothetical protein
MISRDHVGVSKFNCLGERVFLPILGLWNHPKADHDVLNHYQSCSKSIPYDFPDNMWSSGPRLQVTPTSPYYSPPDLLFHDYVLPATLTFSETTKRHCQMNFKRSYISMFEHEESVSIRSHACRQAFRSNSDPRGKRVEECQTCRCRCRVSPMTGDRRIGNTWQPDCGEQRCEVSMPVSSMRLIKYICKIDLFEFKFKFFFFWKRQGWFRYERMYRKGRREQAIRIAI